MNNFSDKRQAIPPSLIKPPPADAGKAMINFLNQIGVHMKTSHPTLIAALLGASLFTPAAHAALESRLGGLALYDSDLNITWLADTNAAKASGYDADGLMDWSQANAWVSGLTVQGISDWRLPATLQPDASCDSHNGSISAGNHCTGSEMGHLFYNELGGVAGSSIAATHNANTGLFQNLQSFVYWSGTNYVNNNYYSWSFDLNNGGQGVNATMWGLNAMAVHNGDVAPVPVPAAGWLLGSGLLGLVGVARRKVA